MKNKLCSGLIIIICLQLILGLSGCGEEVSETITPITLTFYSADGVADPWTDPVAKEITARTGVTLALDYPVSADSQQVLLMIATKDYPDMIFAKGDANRLIEEGALIDLAPLIEEYGPNIRKLYGEELKKLQYSAEDPAIYQLCSTGVGNVLYETAGTAQLQWACIAEAGYEIPYTLTQYENQIKQYLDKYPQINGQDTIGLTLSVADWHWYITLSNPSGYIANGSPDNGQWLIDNTTYEATYKHAAEGQKEYFRWLNRMYAEGVLDQQFATQTHDDYLNKIRSGRVLGLLDADWDYLEAEAVLLSAGQYEHSYCALPVTMDESIPCAALMYQGLTVGWGVGITVDCEDPIAAIRYIDWLCSDEGQVLVHWGIEGVNYFVDENGVRYRTAEEMKRSTEDVTYKATSGVEFHSYPFPTYGNGVTDATGNTYTTVSKLSQIESYNVEQKKALAKWGCELLTDIFPQHDQFPIPPYAPAWSQVKPSKLSNLEAVLDQIAYEGLLDCLLCEPAQFDDNWETMQEAFRTHDIEVAEQMMTELIKTQVEYWK